MSLNVNRVMLAGNLTRDPQVRYLANQTAVADFGLAINHRYKSKDGEQKEDTVYVDITAWGRTAELCGQYLAKGRNVSLEGRLQLEQWEKDGQKRSRLKVTADSVNFVDSGNKNETPRSQTSGPVNNGPSVPPPADLGDSEPPF